MYRDMYCIGQALYCPTPRICQLHMREMHLGDISIRLQGFCKHAIFYLPVIDIVVRTEKKKENIPRSVLENYNDLKERLKTLREQWRQCQGKKEEVYILALFIFQHLWFYMYLCGTACKIQNFRFNNLSKILGHICVCEVGGSAERTRAQGTGVRCLYVCV